MNLHTGFYFKGDQSVYLTGCLPRWLICSLPSLTFGSSREGWAQPHVCSCYPTASSSQSCMSPTKMHGCTLASISLNSWIFPHFSILPLSRMFTLALQSPFLLLKRLHLFGDLLFFLDPQVHSVSKLNSPHTEAQLCYQPYCWYFSSLPLSLKDWGHATAA